MTDPIPRLNAALEGRYRIERELGEGGMATVYLADDVRHERKVALKVLKPELAAVVGAERFLAEIKTTANLQHPHILPLFDSGETDGFLFYVMPYVEGESLRERLDREHQLPMDEAMQIATKVAGALRTAHEQGVIHRDIKPANILLSRGEPLVADFGIALAVGAAGGGRLTETGMSLGTPHYMSPEQATGEAHVGPPTDIYALGCVLYEMLTGEPPYTGGTAQAVLGRIIRGELTPARELRDAVPANVDAALRRALEKVPADRFRTAGELARALEDPGFRWGVGEGAASGARAGAERVWRLFALVLAGVGLLLVGALAWLSAPGRVASASLPVSASLLFPEGAAPARGVSTALEVARDGARIFYTAESMQGGREIRTRSLSDRGSDVAVAGTQGSGSFALSPDGRRIVFNHVADGELKAVPATGGQPTAIVETGLDGGGAFYGMSWGPDGTIVFATSLSGLQRVSSTGGTPTPLTEAGRQAGVFHRNPRFLPDGSGVVFHITQGSQAVEQRALVAVLPFGGEVSIQTDGHSPMVTESGLLIFARGTEGDLWAARLTPDWTELASEPVRVLDGAVDPSGFRAQYAVGGDGSLFFFPVDGLGVSGAPPERSLAWIHRDGTRDTILPLSRVPNATGQAQGARISPDGTRVAFRANVAEVPRYALFVWDLEREAVTRIPVDLNADWPVWLDDQRVVFNRFSSEGQNLYTARADGSGEPEPWTTPNSLQQHANQMTPDGTSLVIQQRPSPLHPDSDIWILPADGSGEGRPVFTDPAQEVQGAVDPSGRWLAYASDRSGRFEVYVTEFPVGRAHILVSGDGGSSPVWNPAGGELFHRNGREMWAVRVATDPVFRVEGREMLFGVDFRDCCGGDVGGFSRTFDVDAEGRRFLVIADSSGPSEESTTAGPFRIEMIQGWVADVERRVDGAP